MSEYFFRITENLFRFENTCNVYGASPRET